MIRLHTQIDIEL